MTELIDAMTEAAHGAGQYLLELPRRAPATTLADFRTRFDAIDAPVAALLRERLLPLRPEAAWVDEFDDSSSAAGEAWVCDATDGAVQYLQGLPQWCVTLTLVRDGEPVAVVLHNPLLKETYTAEAGAGAFRNGERITPSAKAEPQAALVATSQPPFAAAQPEALREAGRSLTAVLLVAGAVRNLGPTSWQLADVAAGRIDAFWEYGRDDANLLPGVLLARESGATVTDAAGAPWRLGATSILVAGPKLHPLMLAALRAGESD
ncbi:inositol monophosphatase family protein [Micromonospora sp. DT201]|uniref:inositol monophosphatase family protein n=1 Tax=Micromonospora sp. DT201 TaxID=3393442 RepID=UPI003CEC141B